VEVKMVKKIAIPLIVALVIISVVFVIYKLLNPANKEVLSQGNYIEAVFLAEDIRPEVANSIHIGDTIYDVNGRPSFKITNLKIEDSASRYVTYDDIGRLKTETASILKNMYIYAKSLSKKYAWAYAYGKDLIMSGAHLSVYGENWKVWTTVLTVTEIK
jgi:hypothetical protein